MLRAQRHKLILDLVNRKGFVTMGDLLAEVGISPATAHRDISLLAENSQLIKVRGGAKAIASVSDARSEPSFAAKQMVNLAEKQRIALAAKQHIHPGDKIMLDSGTTVLELAKLIEDDDQVTVVTNDIRIASVITERPNISLLLIGGMIRRGFCSSYGFFAEHMMRDITVNRIFLSVDAIDSDFGIMSYTMDDVNVKKIGMLNAKETILLCDHSKFTTPALFSIDSLDKVDVIIVGKEIDPAILQRLRQLGKIVEVV